MTRLTPEQEKEIRDLIAIAEGIERDFYMKQIMREKVNHIIPVDRRQPNTLLYEYTKLLEEEKTKMISGNTATAASERGILVELESLEKQVHSLRMGLTQLEKKMTPILRNASWLQDEKPAPDEMISKSTEPEEITSSTRKIISHLRRQLHALDNAINCMTENIDL